jgi:tripartite-type tricarboxylate transporter receptor subunit TctC
MKVWRTRLFRLVSIAHRALLSAIRLPAEPLPARRLKYLAVLAACLLATPMTDSAAALDYPVRTVRIVVPFPAGGVPDVLCRILAQGLTEKWGQPVVVENRGGANTSLGAAFVSRSAPDGYTLLFTTDGTFILNPLLYSNLPYSMGDLTPVSLVASSAHALAVNKDVPVQSVKEFVELAKKKPNGFSYGTSGPGSIQRIAMELFSRTESIELLHVPYKGSGETMTALLAGDINATINGAFNILPLRGDGSVKALAITTTTRSRFAPDLPTMQEAGVRGFSSQGLSGLFAPAGTPSEIMSKLHNDIVDLLKRPEVKQALDKNFFEVQGKDGDEFQKIIREETEKWRRVITEAKIKID